ncbi:death domain-containing protein CRADD-like [Asterias amurensis]|uniref:death domain-containing protein CRADD-like n=1 Tax=Asterias amurensis TaxID=7602 RepID=UPI003AB2D698
MENQDKQRLRKNRCALMDIEPSKVSDHLIQEGIFSPQMMEEIFAQSTAKGQMSKMLNDLEKRGPNAYGKFRSALCEFPVYQHLVEKLDNTCLPVDLDEVDGQPVRQESSRTAGVVTGRGQGRNVTITGNNNFAIIGGMNSNIFMH